MTVLADSPAGRPDVAVVRKPISDERHGLVGYELLFGGESQLLDSAADAKSTSALLVDAFGDIGLEVLAGRHPVWMSIARNFLVEIGPPPVRPDRAVLQIASYPARDDMLAVLQQLGRSGYTIALDDFDGREDVETLLGLCSIVKVDVGSRSDAELARIVVQPKAARGAAGGDGRGGARGLRALPGARLLLLPGRLLRQAAADHAPRVGTGGISSLRALGELSAADASFEDLERIISSDVGLSLKLLRYVNSAFFAPPRNIGSVREALTLLGTRTVRRWAKVMAMSAVPDAPHELVAIALHRARMCEMLAGSALPEERETLFTIGLFSVADGLMSAPMEEVLTSLPFSDEIRAALLRFDGPKGELLSAMIAYERGEFPTSPAAPTAPGVSLSGAYRAALEWADDAGRAVSG